MSHSADPVKRKKVPYVFLIIALPILFWLFCVVIAVVILNRTVDYPFLHGASEIRAIEIVHVGEYDSEIDSPIQTTICTIEDIDDFLEEFSHVNCFRKAPPSYIGSDITAIKIIYSNDDYELIADGGPGIYTKSQKTDTWEFHSLGLYTFDNRQFQRLISKYTKPTTPDKQR